MSVQNGDLLVVKSSAVCEGTLTQQVMLSQGVIVTPNPVVDYVNLLITDYMTKNKVSVQMYNNLGLLLFNKECIIVDQYIRIPMDYLPAGVYMFTIQLEKPVTVKVIKK